MLKALTTAHWGKAKETLLTTYKTITLPLIEYANTVWSPNTSDTNINKLQTIQNTALRTVTGCTLDTNKEHLHTETLTLPIKQHLQLHASQYRQMALHPEHPLHQYTLQDTNPRHKKQTIFDNNNGYTYNLDTAPQNTTEDTIKENKKNIHTRIVQTYTQTLRNKILNAPPPLIAGSEKTLTHSIRRTLAQRRTNKSPLLHSYLHKINPTTYTTPGCPLCQHHIHDTAHLFSCPQMPTALSPEDLWRNPIGAGELVEAWRVAVEAGVDAA